MSRTSGALALFLSLFAALSLSFFEISAAEQGDRILLLAFTSEGCPACRALEPLISGLEQKNYPIQRVSPSDPSGSALYEQFGIETMPSFVLLLDGTERSRFISKGENSRIVQERLLGMFQDASSAASAVQPTPVQPRPEPAAAEPEPAKEKSSLAGLNSKTTGKIDSAEALASTVRLHISNGKNETDCGTGTLIHTNGTGKTREGLILTCGHLFRETGCEKPVQVDLYKQETGESITVTGECVYYDDDLDIGFVGIPLPFPVKPVQIAPPGYEPKQGDQLFSVGCSAGENPSVWEHTVRSTDQKFYRPKDPHSKNEPFYFIEVTNAPRPGRSGGGLFTKTSEGETYLVGVCNAGDPQSDEGYFLPSPVVYDQLSSCSNLAFVYQDILRGQENRDGIQTASFDTDSKEKPGEKIRQTGFDAKSSPADSKEDKLNEIRRCLAQGAEVICIVNWPKDGTGQDRESDVVRLRAEDAR